MTNPQTNPQARDELGDSLERSLLKALAPEHVRVSPPPARPPASSAGPAPVGMWGPTTQRATSPLQLLSDVADRAHRLHEQLQRLVTSVTGEQAPAGRLRQAPKKGNGLLPAISELAHEIESAHGEIERLVQHLQGRVS